MSSSNRNADQANSTKHRISGLMILGLLLVVNACAPDERQEIELGYVEWDSEIASTHLVAAVLEDEFDQNVTLRSAEAGPMWAGLARGDFDATVSAWLPATHQAYWDDFGDELIDLGPNLENAKIGWVVPEYTPIESIEQVNDYYDELDGRIVGIDPGAGLMQASERALEEYGIELNLLEGSAAAMTAALESAYTNQEHIVVTGWTPHWKFSAYDLKYLEDPRGVFGEAEAIHTVVTPELESENPEAFEFLNNFYWTNEQIGEVMILIEEGIEPIEAGRVWLSENEDVLEDWLN